MKNNLRTKKIDLKINAFFNNLPKWDRKNHIGNLSKYITVSEIDGIVKQDADEILRRWLYEFIIYEPKEFAKNKSKLTIIGRQGLGKSTFCDWLLAEIPAVYGSYFLNSSNSISDFSEGRILIVKAIDFSYYAKINVCQVWAQANENRLLYFKF